MTRNHLSSVVKKVASEDQWMEYEHHSWRGIHVSPDVEKKLFDCIWEFMRTTDVVFLYSQAEQHATSSETNQDMKVIKALSDYMMFLVACPNKMQHRPSPARTWRRSRRCRINYMMFLVAVRPGFLPGLKLRSLYEATEDALAKFWPKQQYSSRCNSRSREQCLADILQDKEQNRINDTREKLDKWRQGYRTKNWKPEYMTELYISSIVLSDGIKLADLLLQWLRRSYRVKFPKSDYSHESKFQQMFPKLTKILKVEMYNDPGKLAELLEHIYMEWVRLLINASLKCTRDSQAKQLSRGGELTTIVWILVEHAGTFHVDHHQR
uniref:DUF4220 domain-containing protein n=1 Tax=Oryza punctata TaxID=4537 RepID=A0A0E0KMH0_ORYPU